MNSLASNEGGGGGELEDDGLGHFFGAASSLERDEHFAFLQLSVASSQALGVKGGLDEPRGDGVDEDIVGRSIFGEGFNEAFNTGFGNSVR